MKCASILQWKPEMSRGPQRVDAAQRGPVTPQAMEGVARGHGGTSMYASGQITRLYAGDLSIESDSPEISQEIVAT